MNGRKFDFSRALLMVTAIFAIVYQQLWAVTKLSNSLCNIVAATAILSYLLMSYYVDKVNKKPISYPLYITPLLLLLVVIALHAIRLM